MTLDEAIPLIDHAASLVAWVIGICSLLISTLVGIIWRSRAIQTDTLIASTEHLNQQVTVLNTTMMDVRDATNKQWKIIGNHEREIAILKERSKLKST